MLVTGQGGDRELVYCKHRPPGSTWVSSMTQGASVPAADKALPGRADVFLAYRMLAADRCTVGTEHSSLPTGVRR